MNFRQKVVSAILMPIDFVTHSFFYQKCVEYHYVPDPVDTEMDKTQHVWIKGGDKNAQRRSQHNTGSSVIDMSKAVGKRDRRTILTV